MEKTNILNISCDEAKKIISTLENGGVVHSFSNEALIAHLRGCTDCRGVYKEASNKIKDAIRMV